MHKAVARGRAANSLFLCLLAVVVGSHGCRKALIDCSRQPTTTTTPPLLFRCHLLSDQTALFEFSQQLAGFILAIADRPAQITV